MEEPSYRLIVWIEAGVILLLIGVGLFMASQAGGLFHQGVQTGYYFRVCEEGYSKENPCSLTLEEMEASKEKFWLYSIKELEAEGSGNWEGYLGTTNLTDVRIG